MNKVIYSVIMLIALSMNISKAAEENKTSKAGSSTRTAITRYENKLSKTIKKSKELRDLKIKYVTEDENNLLNLLKEEKERLKEVNNDLGQIKRVIKLCKLGKYHYEYVKIKNNKILDDLKGLRERIEAVSPTELPDIDENKEIEKIIEKSIVRDYGYSGF